MLIRSCIAALLLASAPFAHAETQVKPLAVSVGSLALEGMDFDLRPAGVNPGVSVHVLITGLDTPIVDIDDDNSTLDKATDSTGKDLLEEPKRDDGMMMMMSSSGVGPFPSVSKDGKLAIVEFSAPQPPAVGATSMHFEGTLAVVVATGRKSDTATVALAPGKVSVAGLNLEVTDVAKHDWEEGKSKLVIRMDVATRDQIASWKVAAPDGSVIGEDPFSTTTFGDTVDVEITLDAKPPTAQLTLEVYEGMKRVDVPIKLDVGLGVE